MSAIQSTPCSSLQTKSNAYTFAEKEKDLAKKYGWLSLPEGFYLYIFGKFDLSYRDLVNASLTCRSWKLCIEHERVGERLLNKLPIIPTVSTFVPWMKIYHQWGRFPATDGKTTYNYKIGRTRMALTRQDKILFKTRIIPDRLPRHLLVFKREHTHVSNNISALDKVVLLGWHKTRRLALECVEKWGERYAETVLSAAEPSDHYWNVLYYFGSFNKFLDKIHETGINPQKHGGTKRKREKRPAENAVPAYQP